MNGWAHLEDSDVECGSNLRWAKFRAWYEFQFNTKDKY